MSGNRGTNSGEPPPIPPDAPAAKRGGLSTTAIVLIVCGVLALPVVAGVVTAVAIMVPKMQETARRTRCMGNLSHLANGFIVDSMNDPVTSRRWSGSSMWLAMRRNTTHVLRGAELTLICPGDAAARLPEAPGDPAWDTVDLENPARELCSYAGRDFASFPIDPDSEEEQAIGACVHHRGGAIVAFYTGEVRFMTREDLEISEDDEIRCGRESASPILQKLVGGN